ncbi:DinB family protein, partial [Mycolicibacterium sphagni]|uniref:DinB family protein n=1 Tax=Mycolicibacterium sphagni TaxID=1786 RepID=UPI0021F2DE41
PSAACRAWISVWWTASDLGLVDSVDESYRIADDDTVASVSAAFRDACATAREIVAGLPLETVARGHRAGPRTCVNWPTTAGTPTAHHCGHADILREQILAN